MKKIVCILFFCFVLFSINCFDLLVTESDKNIFWGDYYVTANFHRYIIEKKSYNIIDGHYTHNENKLRFVNNHLIKQYNTENTFLNYIIYDYIPDSIHFNNATVQFSSLSNFIFQDAFYDIFVLENNDYILGCNYLTDHNTNYGERYDFYFLRLSNKETFDYISNFSNLEFAENYLTSSNWISSKSYTFNDSSSEDKYNIILSELTEKIIFLEPGKCKTIYNNSSIEYYSYKVEKISGIIFFKTSNDEEYNELILVPIDKNRMILCYVDNYNDNSNKMTRLYLFEREGHVK